MPDQDNDTAQFIDLIRKSRRGKFKIYIGMSAGVGKTYRMLQEAQSLLRNGVDVKIGYIECHGRKDTVLQLEGLPVLTFDIPDLYVHPVAHERSEEHTSEL